MKKKLIPIFQSNEEIQDLARQFRRGSQELPFHLEDYKLNDLQISDYREAVMYLSFKSSNNNTFKAYRRDLERFYLWMWVVANKSIKELDKNALLDFSDHYERPGKNWVGTSHVARFKKDGTPNKDWRPFVVSIKKSSMSSEKTRVENEGFEFDLVEYKKQARESFKSSDSSYVAAITTVNLLMEYLVDDEYIPSNPVRKLRKDSTSEKNRNSGSQGSEKRLSPLQARYLLKTAEAMANEYPEEHERTLFILSCMYYMYLRVSDFVPYKIRGKSKVPLMSDFSKDHKGDWWFMATGKGNKTAKIAVRTEVLDALKRYRRHLGLTDYPSKTDSHFLITSQRVSNEPIKTTRYIRKLIDDVLQEAVRAMRSDGYSEEADSMLVATPHWLRHTKISEDLESRPILHVKEDARHANLNTTSRYSKADDEARNKTAREAAKAHQNK